MKSFIGTIVLESLTDDRILNELEIQKIHVTTEENPQKRWHIFTVVADEHTIQKISQLLKPEKWYAHFWSGDEVIAIFPGKLFSFRHSDKSTWINAIKYGKSLGIPEQQLDFVIF